jgi:hypothetical protein
MRFTSHHQKRQADQLDRWYIARERRKQDGVSVALVLLSYVAIIAILLFMVMRHASAATPSEENMVAVIVARLPIPDSELARAVAARTLLNVLEATDADHAGAALAAVDLAPDEYRHDGGVAGSEAFLRRLDQAHATIEAIQSPDPVRHFSIAPQSCAHGTRLLFQNQHESRADFARRVGALKGSCQIAGMASVP